MSRPTLLFYCQHSLGLGHLVRSLALAEALADRFEVVLLNGGRLPAGTEVPDGLRMVDLAPLGHDEHYQLVSHDPNLSVAAAMVERREQILAAFDRLRPVVVLVELWPFGRKKFAFELEPLVGAIDRAGRDRTKLVCSVRDILVTGRADQARHDEKAATTANAHFDAILVHADPRFATLDETFHPATPLAVPVHHTGFVAPRALPIVTGRRRPRVIVSAGGGMVGEPLLRAALEAAPLVRARSGLTTTVIAGPFLSEAVWDDLVRARSDDVVVHRQVADLAGEIARSSVSVSQAGYNTTMDLLRARTPAVVVPYAEGNEDEQQRRAERLAAMGVLRVVPSARLSGPTLAAAVTDALTRGTRALDLDLDGAAATARIVAELAGAVGREAATKTATLVGVA